MSRLDISPNLVHFTGGESYEAAFIRLRKIIADRMLIAGSRYIRGNYHCVCFSEAPLTSLTGGLVNEDYYSRYSPFGIMVSKEWLFAKGGRPVIYQSADEYHLLPENMRWRHVLYEPSGGNKKVDFTWEREWRIQCDYLAFDQSCAHIVVLDQSWADRLISEHDREQTYRVMEYKLIFGDELSAEMYRKSFGWIVWTLR